MSQINLFVKFKLGVFVSDPSIALGPSVTGTLVTANFDATVAAYVDSLNMSVAESGVVDQVLADLWQTPALIGQRIATLISPSNIAWIRVVEDINAVAAKPFRELGWMALEVVVADVDNLAIDLNDSAFETYRPPADLDISDAIRAMQVIGPAGEVLYLTQIGAAVPPFVLPVATCRVDHLFIPVMCCHDRETATQFYESFGGTKAYRFDTKITSLNKAYGYDLDRRHPVSTVQLAGATMIEIDQIDEAQPRPLASGSLPAGIAMITYLVDDIDSLDVAWIAPPQPMSGVFYQNRKAGLIRCPGGELIELVARH
jgi:hypothetical protein